MRRASFAFVAIACWGAAACGPDLPERMWRSDNVRYFSRDSDSLVCPAILDEIEQHGQVIADVLLIGRTLVSYYKFDGLDDFDSNADCGAGASACAPNATVRSPADFDRHELIHAYLSPYGRPPWLLTEGAAVALSCQRHPRPTGTWQQAYALAHDDPALYAAGGWLVGYLLKMFPARLLPRLYSRLQVNASPDQFAAVFEDIYGMTPDAIWAAAIGGPGQPMRCPWECGRPGFAIDGQARALAPACSGGSLQLSVDVPNPGLSRWRIDGAGRFTLQSCDGSDAPLVSVSGTSGPGELVAPVNPGSYFIDAVVEEGGTPSLSAAVSQGDGLSWAVCSGAPVLADDLSALSSLTLFYPSSAMVQFSSLPTATSRPGQVFVSSFDPAASVRLCTGCDQQTCATADRAHALTLPVAPPSTLLGVPGGGAVTATFRWN